MHLDKKTYNIFTYKDVNVKIVQISDIHFSIDYKLERLNKLRNKIDIINPLYVCIVGDLIDEYGVVETNYINYFKDWLKGLSLKYKVIISMGNHDFIVKSGEKYIEHNNIDWLLELKSDSLIVLNNDVYSENGINFIGYNPDFEFFYTYKEKRFSNYNNELSDLLNLLNGYNILMIHAPSVIVDNDNYKNINGFDLIDLVISGHTHGGLVPSFIPGNFGLISPHKTFFPKCVRGKIKRGKADVIISSGVVKLSRKSKLTKLNDIYGYNINVINIKKV